MLPLLISAFRRRHPQPAFHLSQGARDGCLAELAAGDADLALTAPIAAPSRLISSAALYREPLRLVVHHSHTAGHAPPRPARGDQARSVRGHGAPLRHALADGRTVPGSGIPAPHRLRKPGLPHGPGPRIRRPRPSASSRPAAWPPAATPRGSQGTWAGWSSRWSPAWPSGEIGLAWRERRGGADAEPDPVRLFRNWCSARARRCWPASSAGAPATERIRARHLSRRRRLLSPAAQPGPPRRNRHAPRCQPSRPRDSAAPRPRRRQRLPAAGR